LIDHTEFPARDYAERLCVCLHTYDDHVMRVRRVPCDETEAGRRCPCADFRCWEHPDNECAE
jgi:hypothetical protein